MSVYIIHYLITYYEYTMFTEKEIENVWSHALAVEGYDPNVARKDACGAWMLKSQYGIRDSSFGWEIDHVYPENLGGQNHLENLRAMQWENNVSKGNDYPTYKSKVQADGNRNVYKEEQYTVNDTLQKLLSDLYKF